jgi:membrane protein
MHAPDTEKLKGILSSTRTKIDRRLSRYDRLTWEFVSNSPLRSLWNLRGVPLRVVAGRTWKSVQDDRIFGHAAELGFYFFFALFPALVSATSILGLIARSASSIYDRLLQYLALVIPAEALSTVLRTFNETSAASSSGKLTFGLVVAAWTASSGMSAIQDTLNVVYKIEDSRSFLRARIEAIVLTVIVSAIVSSCLASLLGGDFFAAMARHRIHDGTLSMVVVVAVTVVEWLVATGLLALAFAVVYYWAPDHKTRLWHWFTPGGAIGLGGWLVASVALRVYLHFFNSYSVTYGSLGAVIILLTWFYMTGLMLLVGAEINSEIEAAAAARHIGASAPLDSTAAEAAGECLPGTSAPGAADQVGPAPI